MFVTGHSEYDPLTLKREYDRDRAAGRGDRACRAITTRVTIPSQPPQVRWRGHANLLYANWLNYYVYQVTPYDLTNLTLGVTRSDF